MNLKIGVIGFVPPQIVQWDKAHLDGKATDHRHRRCGEQARARSQEGRRRHRRGALPFRHRRRRAEGRRGERGAASREGRRHRRDPHRPPASHLPRRQGVQPTFPASTCKAGTLHGKPAVMAGFWGSHLGLIDLELTEGGRCLEGREFPHRGAPDLRRASTARSCRRSIPTPSCWPRRRPTTTRR